jgi:hypothetical protein
LVSRCPAGLAQTFSANGLATAAVLVVVSQVGWVGFGELGRVGWERPFVVAEVLEGRTAVFASPWSGKAVADVVGKVVWYLRWFCCLWRGLVGKCFGNCERFSRERPVLCTRVMEGKRPFSIIIFRSSQRRNQFSQSASAQGVNKFLSRKPAKTLVRRPA